MGGLYVVFVIRFSVVPWVSKTGPGPRRGGPESTSKRGAKTH